MYDRDDKDQYGNHEESEYHFSDEDVNYESGEIKKTSPLGSLKTRFLTRFQKSRRLYIGIFVFVVLVYISYQMLFPSNPKPVTEFTTAKPQTAAPASTEVKPAEKTPVVTTSPVIPVGQVTITVPQAQNITQPAPPAVQPQPVSLPQAVPAAAQPVPVPVTQPVLIAPAQPVVAPAVTGMPPTQQQQASTVPQSQPVVAIPPPVSAVPQMIPIPVAAPSQPQQNLAPPNPLQAEYIQKFNEFEAQNKATQEQIAALAAKVTTMEEQLNQLVNSLNKPTQPELQTPPTVSPKAPVTGEPRASYTVQAIIPGRAWLKSDSGETVTVAEGDVLRGYGRVTKIDPYNGVVEIDTGSKIMALSYGSGG